MGRAKPHPPGEIAIRVDELPATQIIVKDKREL
jgi:hypothetical protein